MDRRNWVITGLLLVAVLVGLAGPTTTGQVQAQGGISRVRFLHAVPGAPEVDVYMDGQVVVSRLGYGEVTPHLSTTAGDHLVALRAAGSDATAPALIEVPVPLAANLAFMIIAQGSPEALQAALYEDILDELAPGMARLTAINAIADAPALDVLTTAGGPLLQGVNYGAQFGTVNIGTGLQDLVIVPAGGALDSAVATIGQVKLQSNTLYTLVALGTLDGAVTPSTLVLATPVNGSGDAVRVRVAHGSPDAPAVDVYANDILLFPSLELGEMTGHIALPAGTYTLGLRPAGSPVADAPVVSAEVTLDPATPAVTVAAVGELSDGSLALQTFVDDVAGVVPDKARFAVINAVPGATVTATLVNPGGVTLVSGLAANTQGAPVDAPAAEYLVNVSVQGVATPVDVAVPVQQYVGGMYYSLLVFGGGVTEVPYNARVAGTEIVVMSNSLPVVSPAVVAAPGGTEPLPTATAEPPTSSSEVVAAVPTQESSEVVVAVPTEAAPPLQALPTATLGTELVVDSPTPTGGSEVVPAQATPLPLVPQAAAPVAYVELDPGANLHCRELPSSDARSLGLIPSGTTVTVIGRPGIPLVPETGNPTPEPTPVIETLEQMWLSVQWDTPDGGYLRCWVAAQFLRVEFKGKLLDTLEELLELPEEPFNRPGEAVNTSIKPPTPVFDAVIATVQLEPGVSLQLRRNPKTDAEALDRVPAGAQLVVLGYAEVPSEGLVGQPVDPNWLKVRYTKENGGATIGWVSAQYVTLSRQGRPVEITELLVLDPTEPGFYEAPGTQPVIPIELQAVIGVVNLNPGANLNLRDRPSADARVVIAIPSGDTVTLKGRNGDGTWVQVTYTSAGVELEGWVAVQYLVVTQGGQPVNLAKLPNVSDQPDIMGTPTVVPPAQ